MGSSSSTCCKSSKYENGKSKNNPKLKPNSKTLILQAVSEATSPSSGGTPRVDSSQCSKQYTKILQKIRDYQDVKVTEFIEFRSGLESDKGKWAGIVSESVAYHVALIFKAEKPDFEVIYLLIEWVQEGLILETAATISDLYKKRSKSISRKKHTIKLHAELNLEKIIKKAQSFAKGKSYSLGGYNCQDFAKQMFKFLVFFLIKLSSVIC